MSFKTPVAEVTLTSVRAEIVDGQRKKKEVKPLKITYLQKPDGLSKVIVVFNPTVNEREDKKI